MTVKVPVCISPCLRDRWLTLISLPELALWFIGGHYIMITSILAGVGLGMNHVGAQGPEVVDTHADSGKSENLFSGLITILMVLCCYY